MLKTGGEPTGTSEGRHKRNERTGKWRKAQEWGCHQEERKEGPMGQAVKESPENRKSRKVGRGESGRRRSRERERRLDERRGHERVEDEARQAARTAKKGETAAPRPEKSAEAHPPNSRRREPPRPHWRANEPATRTHAEHLRAGGDGKTGAAFRDSFVV